MVENQESLVHRSRVEGLEDVDCVGKDGVLEANVHKIVHALTAAVAFEGAVRAVPELAAGALQLGWGDYPSVMNL